MPAIYAHDRFGKEVAERVLGEPGKTVRRYYTQFKIGLQGPDIFFFYRFNTDNPIVSYGQHLHRISALPFFRHAVDIIRKKGCNSREYAYLLGFLCHFILDSECHPYVEDMIEVTGVQHLEIEEEFEKLLLRLDGQDPVGYPLADLIPTDPETVRAIYPFYRTNESITPKIIFQSLRYMKLIKRFLTAPGKLKHAAINTGMKLTGKYPYVKGLMNQRVDNPNCKESNEGLLTRFDAAIDLAAGIIGSLDESIRTGKPLSERLDRNFE